MKRYFILLALFSVFAVACTPQAQKEIADEMMEDDKMEQGGDEKMEGKDYTSMNDDQMKDAKDSSSSDAVFNVYENKAIGYTVEIPTNWYWRHFYKTEIGDLNPNVEDYLFISPTKSIEGIQTESPAEIVVEVSSGDIDSFKDESLNQKEVTIAGQAGLMVSGVVNNNVFSDYQKIEYRFTKDGKTYRILYLAPAGLDNNEDLFEQIVKSFKFTS